MNHQTLRVTAVNDQGMSATVAARSHTWRTDEPADLGGLDTDATPVEMLLGALASCTVITVRMYAARKGWPVHEIRADVEGEKDPSGRVLSAQVRVALQGDLDNAQRARLLDIAGKCPVHKALAGGVNVSVHPQ